MVDLTKLNKEAGFAPKDNESMARGGDWVKPSVGFYGVKNFGIGWHNKYSRVRCRR